MPRTFMAASTPRRGRTPNRGISQPTKRVRASGRYSAGMASPRLAHFRFPQGGLGIGGPGQFQEQNLARAAGFRVGNDAVEPGGAFFLDPAFQGVHGVALS
jgi:hypothetical protein